MRSPATRRPLARWSSALVLAVAASAAPLIPASAAEAAPAGRLTWAPPVLSDPVTVQVSATRRSLRLDPARDYVLQMPSTPLEVPGGLVVDGGNDVVLVGGEVRTVGSGQEARGLYLKNQTGTVHVEGLRISGETTGEGIDLDQRRGATVQLQNIAVDGVHGSRSGHHADVLQTWGGPAVLRVDRLEGATSYQGFFLDPMDFHPTPPALVDLRNVTLRDLGGTSATLLWQSGTFPITTSGVVLVPPASNPQKVATRTAGGQTSWDAVTRADASTPSPLTGAPGLGYTSPGYASDPVPAPRLVVDSVERREGGTRYETAVAVSRASHGQGSADVVVASGQDYPDALAAGQVAAGRDASLLLVPSSGEVPAAVTAELARLAPQRITLVGGPGAVDDAVLAQLATRAPAERIAGTDRYATAAAAATAVGAVGGTVFVASGGGFADALAGGALAAHTGDSLLLSATDRLPEPTAAALAALAPRRVVLLGGTAALSDAVRSAVGAVVPTAQVERWAGADRYATAAEVARLGYAEGATTAVLTSGANFPDALAGAPAAGAQGSPLLLVQQSCVPAPTTGALLQLAPRGLVVLGGHGAVAAGVDALTPC